jgi:selenocysteine lyase/cysteine desulfurase
MRDFFHTPDNYFLSHSVGCLPIGTQDIMGQNFFNPWGNGQNWQDWMPLLERLRGYIGTSLNVDARNICPQTNISSALTKIIYSLPVTHSGLSERRKIILSKEDFPTVGFVFRLAERMGYEISFIDGHPADINAWKHAIDDKAAIVHITHALSNTSHLLPVEEICGLARDNGAISIVDIAQSFGAVPVPLAAWNCDFATGTGVKFLCAGPGACFLYASDDRINDCRPLDVGWFSHDNPFEMDIENFRYAKDAMKYFGGTPSVAPIVTANAAFELWDIIGMDKAFKQIQNLLDKVRSEIDDQYLVSPEQTGARGATLVISPPNREALERSLKAGDIKYDERREGFRFSMHGYISDEEVDHLIAVLKAALA